MKDLTEELRQDTQPIAWGSGLVDYEPAPYIPPLAREENSGEVDGAGRPLAYG
jgi:hypothetical protein